MNSAAEECNCPFVDNGPSIANSAICSGYYLFMIILEGFIKGSCKISTPCQRVKSADEVESEYDFIVVGAGSAGPIVAARLAEVEGFKVLLIEAGGQDPTTSRVPSFYRTFWGNEELDWNYRTVPENYCLDQGGKGCQWPRGKVLGGCSVLNGMMYHRGHPADYDDWVKAGAEGWSWDENRKYFDMTEGNRQIGSVVKSEYHSSNGPLPIQRFGYQPSFLEELLKAINEAELPVIQDMNNLKTPSGFNVAQTMSKDGQRYSTARAYLKPDNSNLSVKLNALVTRIIFEDKKAVAVEYVDNQGNNVTVRAKKEIILSAGALNTPHLLLLSGVGPKVVLDQFNIPTVADLPVGQNLKNHYGMTLYYNLTKMNDTRVLDWSVATEYLLKGDGPMSADGITQVTGLMYSSLADKDRQQVDLQFFFNGLYAECSRTGVVGEPGPNYPYGTSLSTNCVLLKPKSVGYLTLQSSDPFDPPLFYPNYFSHEDDFVMLREAARKMKTLFESDIMKNKYGAELVSNPCSGTNEVWSDDWIDCVARLHTDAQNHQSSTAAIGLVIDPELKVLGLEGLRVADASSMPSQVTGNPQGAVMLIAERAAAMIKSDWTQ